MKALREIGVRFSIDDFGTGYSSLSYLHRLHVDAIKLDRSFAQSIDTDEGAMQLVQALIGMARALGLKVVAEGVETESQRDALVASGCLFMQGYLFCRPQPASSFDALLEGRRSSSRDLGTLCAAIGAEPEMVSV
jgi:EAL domain-containing protein (putative c-di-GMP-specific phosphodiesterase class I)